MLYFVAFKYIKSYAEHMKMNYSPQQEQFW